MGKFEKKATKKPITKKWWFWTLAALIVVGVVGNLFGSNDDAQTMQETVPDATMAVAETTQAPEAETTAPSALPFAVQYSPSFRNDKTGNWRRSLIATTEPVENYAYDYYKEYFESDDEVHLVYNFTLNTVNTMSVQSGLLCVSVTEYVDGEEHDAGKAASGQSLGQHHFSVEDGSPV